MYGTVPRPLPVAPHRYLCRLMATPPASMLQALAEGSAPPPEAIQAPVNDAGPSVPLCPLWPAHRALLRPRGRNTDHFRAGPQVSGIRPAGHLKDMHAIAA